MGGAHDRILPFGKVPTIAKISVKFAMCGAYNIVCP